MDLPLGMVDKPPEDGDSRLTQTGLRMTSFVGDQIDSHGPFRLCKGASHGPSSNIILPHRQSTVTMANSALTL